MNHFLKLLAVFVVVSFVAVMSAQATDYCWDPLSGGDPGPVYYVDNVNSWWYNAPPCTNGTLPGAADVAIVKVPEVMTYDAAHQPWAAADSLTWLIVGYGDDANQCIPASAPGFVNQAGGTLDVASWILMGRYDLTGMSVYTMTDGAVLHGGGIRIGDHGNATLTATESTIQSDGDFIVAWGQDFPAGTTGIVTLNDSSVTTPGTVVVGHGTTWAPLETCGERHATMTMNGSSSLTGGNMYVALWNDADAQLYVRDDSTVKANGILRVGDSQTNYANFYCGGGTDGHTYSVGLLEISGNATVTAVGETIIGNNNDGYGTVNIGSAEGLATLDCQNQLRVGNSGSVGYLNINEGGLVKAAGGYTYIGAYPHVGAFGYGEININGGTLDRRAATATLSVGYYGGTGIITLNSGSLLSNTADVRFGRANPGGFGSATFNLNGGLLEAASIHSFYWNYATTPSKAEFNFNSGTYRLTASRITLYEGADSGPFTANVMQGGAIIDTNGFDAAVGAGLLDGDGLGGGLTKLNEGVLTLRGANTYTGPTTVNAGGLELSNTGSVTTSDILMGDQTKLRLIAAGSTVAPLNMYALGAVGGGVVLEQALTPAAAPGADAVNANTVSVPGPVQVMVGAQGPAVTLGVPYVIAQAGAGGVVGPGPVGAVSLMRGINAVAAVVGGPGGNINVTLAGEGGPANLTWTGAASADWDVIGTANWQDPIPNPDMFYELDNVTFDGTDLALGTPQPNVNVTGRMHPASITVDTTNQSYTFSGRGEIITHALTVGGGGTVTFNNNGGVSVMSPVTLTGGTLRMASESGDNTMAGAVTLSGGAIINLDNQATLRLPGVISDAANSGLTLNGLGYLVVGNANTYMGPTKIYGGVLVASKLANQLVASSIGRSTNSANNLRFNGDGVLYYTGPSVSIARGFGIDGSGGIYVADANATLEFTGAISSTLGVGTFTKAGDGTLKLNSGVTPNVFANRLRMLGGTLILDGHAAPGKPVTEYQLNENAYVGSDGYCTGTYGHLIVTNETTLTVASNMYMAVDGGDGALTIEDLGVVNVAGYAGFAENGGRASLTMTDSAQLNIGGSGRIGGISQGARQGTMDISLSDNAEINVTAGFCNVGERFYDVTCTLNDHAKMNAVTGNIDFGYGEDTNVTAVLNGFAQANALTNLSIAVNGSNAHADITMNDRSKMTCGWSPIASNGDAYRHATATLTMNGTTAADPVTFASNDWIAIGDARYADAVVTMSGYSKMTAVSWLAVGNVYDGVGSGEAFLSDNAEMSLPGELEIAWGNMGYLHIGDGTLADNAVVKSGTPVVLGWRTSPSNTDATIDINGGGTLECPGIFTGGDLGGLPMSSVLNFDGGTLKATGSSADFISNSSGAATTFAVNVLAGGAIIDTNSNNITIATPLLKGADPDGGLTKKGLGTLAINSDCTYTGLTTVEQGTLGGTGSLLGDVIVNAGASLGPGASIGDLEIGGDVTLNGTLVVEYNQTTDPAIDLLIVGGDLDLTNASVKFVNLDATLYGHPRVFVTYDGDLTGTFGTVTDIPTGYSIDYSVDGQIALVPEPGTLILLAGLFLTLLAWRRVSRRRK